MKTKTIHSLIITLILSVCSIAQVHAVDDAEFEALEKQIEQLEAGEKKKADAIEKKKAEAEKKRLAELERQRQEEQKRVEEEKLKLEEERKRLEDVREAELERKRQEDEAKRLAEEEATTSSVTVIFFRKTQIIGFLSDTTVTHNGTKIASVSIGSSFTYSTTPGKHTFDVSSLNVVYGAVTYEFEPRQTYYISILISGKRGTTRRVSLQRVSEAEGSAAIKAMEEGVKQNNQDYNSIGL